MKTPNVLFALPAWSLIAFATLLTAPPVHAATYTWQNIGTAFTTGADWSPSGPPAVDADLAQFTTFGTFAGASVDPVLNAAVNTGLWFDQTASGAGYTLSGNGSATVGSGRTSSGLVTRGIANTTINLGDGTATSLSIQGTQNNTSVGIVSVGYGSTLTLAGNTVANFWSPIILGTLVLDNSAGNPNSQRLTGSAFSVLSLIGGGSTLEFKGANGGSSFSGLTGLSSQSGSATVRLNQANAAGQLAVTASSLTISSGSTVNFVNAGAGTLGGGGTNPTLKFTTAPSLTNGVVGSGTAIVNGSDFATYNGTTGISAVASTAVSGALSTNSTQNSNLTGNATVAGGTTITYNTLKIAPTAANQSLVLGTSSNLTASGILLAGSTDYAITGASGSRVITSSSGGTIFVGDPTAVLSLDTNIGPASPGFGGTNITKGGDGFLWLNGTANQVSYSSNSPTFVIGGGVLRVNSTSFDLGTAKAPILSLRGGTLEYDVSGGAFTFARSLGTFTGTVNWQASLNTGSGGFSAYAGSSNSGAGNGNALTVNLGNANATLTWGTTASFVGDGLALKFGSTKSNSTVIWQNPLALDGGTAGNATIRQIDVTKGVGNAADKTQFTGAITGSSTTDLVKTGTGTLEFTANNTYSGNTLLAGGNLLLSHASALGGGGKIGFAGGTLQWSANNTVDYSARFSNGASQSYSLDTNGQSVTLATGLTSSGGTLTKLGAGSLALSGSNTYTGMTAVSGGTLKFALANALYGGNSTLWTAANLNVKSGATLAFNVGGSGQFTTANVTTLLTNLAASSSATNGMNAGATLGFDLSSASITIADIIADTTGAGGGLRNLVFLGSRTLTLTGNNTYSGSTTIASGQLSVGSGGTSGRLGGGAVVNNGTLSFERTDSYGGAVNNVFSGTGAMRLLSGVLALGGNNSYSGATILSGGLLILGHKNALGTGTFSLGGSSGTGVPTLQASLDLSASGSGPVANNWNLILDSIVSGSNNLTLSGTYQGAFSDHTLTNSLTGGASLVLSGPVGISRTSTDVALVFAGTGNTTISGNITNGSTATASALTQSGTGTLLLSGTNSYGGATTVSAGTMQFAKAASYYGGDTALWTAALTRVGSGGTLAFNVGGSGEFSSANVTSILANLAVSANATNGMNAGSNLGFDTSNATGGNFTIGDVIANTTGSSGGSRGLIKLGANTLILSGNNTYNGTTTISAGTLAVGNGGTSGTLGGGAVTNNGTLAFNRSDAVSVSNLISGTGALTKLGAGNLTLTANNTYSGNTTISAGTLAVGNGGTSGTLGSAAVSNEGTLQFNRSDDLSVSNVISGSGSLTKLGAGKLALSSPASTFSGNISVQGGTLEANVGGSAAAGALGKTDEAGRTITVDSGATLQFSANDVMGNAGVVPAVAVIINGGTVTNSGNFFNTLGPLTLNAGTLNSVGGALSTYQAWSLGGEVTVGGSAASTISASGSDSGVHLGTSTTFNVADVTSDGNTDLLVEASLLDLAGLAGTSDLVKTGAGTMTLTAASGYTGTTTINSGALQIGNGGTSGALGSGSVILSSAALVFNRTDDYGGPVNNAISGNGGLKLSSGTLTLGGDSSFVGDVLLENENTTLIIGNKNALGSAVLYFGEGTVGQAAVDLSGANAVSNVLSMQARTTFRGTNNLTFTGPFLGVQQATLISNELTDGANLMFGGDFPLGSAYGNIVLTFGGPGSTTFSGNITDDPSPGGSGLTKTGTGTLLLSGTNTYRGATTISEGTLQIGNGGTSGTLGSGEVSNEGALVFNRSDDLSVDNVISGTGSLTKLGAGKLAITANNTYSGNTIVSSGMLLANNPSGSAFGSGDVSVASGATLGGSGSLTGDVTIEGILAPGNSIASLSSGGVTFMNSSTFAYEMDSSVSPVTGADLQIIAGDLDLAGIVTLTLSDIAGSPAAFTDGTKFALFNYSGIWNGGLFTIGTTIGDDSIFTFGLNTWQMDYNDITGGSNFSGEYISGSFVTLTAIPEPSTIALEAGALLCLLFWRKSKKGKPVF